MLGAVFIAAMVAFCPPQAEPAPTEANRVGWLKEMIKMMPTATDESIQSIKDENDELKDEKKKLNGALWKLKDALERKDKKLDEYKRAVGGNQNEEHGKRR